MSRPAPDAGPADGDRAQPGPSEAIASGTTAEDLSAVPDTPEKEAPERAEPPKRGGPFSFLRELPGLILLAFLLALLIKTFLVQAFFIPSESMVPTLQIGDRVLVNKLVYDFGEPQRGDLIVFERPDLPDPDRNVFSALWAWVTEGLGFSSDPTRDFIKRVIALPGETIEVRKGRVFIDGERLREPYVNKTDNSDNDPFIVPEGHVFVMGDNRPNSQDSRIIGPIPEEKIVGKAFVKLWPPSRVEWLSDD